MPAHDHDPAEYRRKAAAFYREGFDRFGDECTQIANALEREQFERDVVRAICWAVVAVLTAAWLVFKS